VTNVDSGGRAAAEPNTILRATVGSKLHGLNLEATDDTDEMGVCVEPPEYVVGLRKFEQWVYRTQPEGYPSGPEDLDLTIYSLRKWVRLALAGNPTVLLLLFAQPSECRVRTARGAELQQMAPSFISRAVAEPYLGYFNAQRQRLTGERGGRALRKGLALEKPGAGYDTKYAAQREFTMAIRRGEVNLDEVLARASELEQRISGLKASSSLPERPETDLIQDWMVRTYLDRWADTTQRS